MRFVSKKIIETNRELSDLDLFTLDFIKILRKHTNYVIVSGYVSILLGRARASEDVDLIIPKMDFNKFRVLLRELSSEFYCLNAEVDKEVYDYVSNRLAVRFAKKGTVIPNIELKFAKNMLDKLALNNTITVRIGKEEVIISQLELQIAVKERFLKSSRDLEDARHLRTIAEGHLDDVLINKYERIMDGI